MQDLLALSLDNIIDDALPMLEAPAEERSRRRVAVVFWQQWSKCCLALLPPQCSVNEARVSKLPILTPVPKIHAVNCNKYTYT